MPEKGLRYARIRHDHPALDLPSAATRGTWLSMYAVADAMWPASASVPRHCLPKAIKELEAKGLIVMEGPVRFRSPDLDELRQGVSDQARENVGKRHDRSTPVEQPNNGGSTGDLLQDATQRDATQRDGTQHDGDATTARPPDDAGEVWDTIGRLTGSNTRSRGYDDQVRDLVRRHGSTAVVAAVHQAAEAVPGTPAVRQLVLGASDDLDRVPKVTPEDEHERTVRQLKERARATTEAAQP